jgi:hypothetical protein
MSDDQTFGSLVAETSEGQQEMAGRGATGAAESTPVPSTSSVPTTRR